MPELDQYQFQQLTGQAECYLHSHPKDGAFTVPHGAFSDLVAQTASVNTATPMLLRTVDIQDGISVVDDSKVTVPQKGVYNVQFSAQFINSDSSAHAVDVWFNVNGLPLANSNTVLTVPSKHGSTDGHAVAAWNIFLELLKGDYVEIMWSTPVVYISLEYRAAATGPVRPAIPSVIATINHVSD